MCAMEGGHLVSLHAEPENEFVWWMANQESQTTFPVWIGWRRGGDDEYRYRPVSWGNILSDVSCRKGMC